MGESLRALIHYLADSSLIITDTWHGWIINSLHGGANNRLYRALRGDDDLVVKFTIRDSRDRAGREFAALSVLQEAGLSIAPVPILLDRDSYAQPVIVQTFLAGETLDGPPKNEDEWRTLIAHYAAIHSVIKGSVQTEVHEAIVNMPDVATGVRLIEDQMALIPPEARPASLSATLERLMATPFPHWPIPTFTLCRVDPNSSNFMRRKGSWASVDWENSGWGDPIFELADLWTHPAYADVPRERRDWVVTSYCTRVDDPTALLRVRCYTLLMLVWWMARTARLLYEVPLGGDQRLVARPADWAARARAQFELYHREANDVLHRWEL